MKSTRIGWGFLGRQGGSGKQEDEKQNFFHDKEILVVTVTVQIPCPADRSAGAARSPHYRRISPRLAVFRKIKILRDVFPRMRFSSRPSRIRTIRRQAAR